MKFYLSDILDIVLEYIHRNRYKNKLVNSFYLPIISFLNINKKYYKFDLCKKHIRVQYNFELSNVISLLVEEYINAIKNYLVLPVSFDTEIFIEILVVLLTICKKMMSNIKDEIRTDKDIEIKNYHNELDLWLQNKCFQLLLHKNPQDSTLELHMQSLE